MSEINENQSTGGESDTENRLSELSAALHQCDYETYEMIQELRDIARLEPQQFMSFVDTSDTLRMESRRMRLDNEGHIEALIPIEYRMWLGHTYDPHADNEIKKRVIEHQKTCMGR